MGKKLLIDLDRLRNFKETPCEAILKRDDYAFSFKSVRELATFMFTCRRCEKAPCIEACPAEALEKDERGMVKRAMLRCIRCKSCICICPFGTMMDNLFEIKISGRKFINLKGEKEMMEFAGFFPDDVVSMVDGEENQAEHIYRFSDDILIKENIWQ
ncbi:MAG TPA: 4Fe-4S dicluster domain-containing protein [Bacteroidales bacterium]|nr:4Fe-4S dicluster domain-containing protein [Bacteroidales bacterium]